MKIAIKSNFTFAAKMEENDTDVDRGMEWERGFPASKASKEMYKYCLAYINGMNWKS